MVSQVHEGAARQPGLGVVNRSGNNIGQQLLAGQLQAVELLALFVAAHDNDMRLAAGARFQEIHVGFHHAAFAADANDPLMRMPESASTRRQHGTQARKSSVTAVKSSSARLRPDSGSPSASFCTFCRPAPTPRLPSRLNG